MTKIEKVVEKCAKLGFVIFEDSIVICKGPKAKQDILLCWECSALNERGANPNRQIQIGSAYTFTELAKRPFTIIPNTANTCIYGDFVTNPLPVA